jgi:EAL domain-containing protein (putative c-di-GMP-specific phosphodiesterase class I)
VEDEAAVDAARRMGVDFLQGYAIGKPEPLALAA